jgi:hypothetical protein
MAIVYVYSMSHVRFPRHRLEKFGKIAQGYATTRGTEPCESLYGLSSVCAHILTCAKEDMIDDVDDVLLTSYMIYYSFVSSLLGLSYLSFRSIRKSPGTDVHDPID